MRGGHFVYGLCRTDNGGVSPPNCAYPDEDQARAELLQTQTECPTESWIVKTIWLCNEVDKSYGDIGGSDS